MLDDHDEGSEDFANIGDEEDSVLADDGRYDLSLQLYEAGRSEFEAGRHEAAVRVLQQSWELYRSSKTAEILARAYAALRQLEPALDWFDVSVHLNPRRQGVYRFRAEVHERLGNLGAALRDYETAVAINPDYKRCREAAARIREQIAKRGGPSRE
jgi:tetratricopeptide (TPR) repeat protein